MRYLARLLILAGLLAGFLLAPVQAQALPWNGTMQLQEYNGTTYDYRAVWVFRHQADFDDMAGCTMYFRNDTSTSITIKMRYMNQSGSQTWADSGWLDVAGHSSVQVPIDGLGYKNQANQPQIRYNRQSDGTLIRILNPANLNGSSMTFLANQTTCL